MRISIACSATLFLLIAGCTKPPTTSMPPDDSGDDDDDNQGDDDDPDANDGPIEPPPPPPVDDEDLTWQDANLTMFISYPEPGSEECEEFSGCEYQGRFSFVDGQQSEEWDEAHNIAAVHSNVSDQYALKTLRVRSGDMRIDVVVYDECSDSDCDGCCTRNSSDTGFLIDLESYTSARFGMEDGIVEFECLDCD